MVGLNDDVFLDPTDKIDTMCKQEAMFKNTTKTRNQFKVK